MSFSQLRPLGFGEILDGAFTLYRRQFASMFLTALVPQIPMIAWSGLYGFWASSLSTNPEALASGDFGALIPVLAVLPIALLGMAVGMGAVVFQVSRAYTGSPVDTRGALRRGMQRLLPLCGAMIVVWIMMCFGLILCILPGLLIAIASFAVIPAVVLERRGPIEAIQRSWQLISDAWGEVFLVVLVAGIIAALPGWAVSMVSLVGIVAAKGDPQATMAIQAGAQVLAALVRTLTIPFSLGCTVLLYYDRRVRTEALDVQMMAESLNTPGDYPGAAGHPGGGYPGAPGYAAPGYQGGPPPPAGPESPAGPSWG